LGGGRRDRGSGRGGGGLIPDRRRFERRRLDRRLGSGKSGRRHRFRRLRYRCRVRRRYRTGGRRTADAVAARERWLRAARHRYLCVLGARRGRGRGGERRGRHCEMAGGLVRLRSGRRVTGYRRRARSRRAVPVSSGARRLMY